MYNKVTALIYIIMWGMVEMVICLVVAVGTTPRAAGRAAGLLPFLPRFVFDILGAVVDILGAVVDILGAVTEILGGVAEILGAGVLQPLAYPAATASHTALPLVTAIVVVTEGEFVLFLMGKHRGPYEQTSSSLWTNIESSSLSPSIRASVWLFLKQVSR